MLLLLAISVFLGCIWIPIGVIFFIAGIIYIAVVYFDASKHLLKLTGAQEIPKESNPEIYEIVEELCLAANIPIPNLYIAPTTEVNAFATGIDPEHASLVLYQGLLDIMNKQEVQGVIGHELSHIRNYDIRITVISSSLMNLIFMTGVGATIIGGSIAMSDAKGWFAFVIKILGMVMCGIGIAISVVAIPLAKLFSLLISRQREYLADVGSVDLTREPSGLISALQKLEELENNPQLLTSKSNNLVLNNLYFNVNITKWWQRLFSDHPPLDKRIQRLKDSNKI